ncbi:MAG TPA: MMPL family transporter [Verrucomicrobiae bacterium]|nr:MMPL family transporter [Verrucomicrobiae bacterium]
MSRLSRLSRHWLWLLLALPIALGLWRLRFDAEVLNLLPPRSPAVQGLKLYQENFSNARELIVTVRADEPERAEAAASAIAAALRQATNLASRADWQPPWLEHPGHSAELIAFLWFNQPPGLFAELTNRLTDTAVAASLADAREQLATGLSPDSFALRGYDPFNLTRLPESVSAGVSTFNSGQEFFAAADGTFRVVFVEAARDLASYRACITWLNEVKAIVASTVEPLRSRAPGPAQSSSLEISYTGRPAFVAEIAGGMQEDMAGPSAGTLAVIALLFYLAHRRWRPLIWLLVLLLLILAGAMALGVLIYGTLNVVSLGFASILLGLAEDFGIVLYQESRSHPGLSLAELRREAAPGIFWSALTTAGAFLLLNLSSIPGLGQLGTLVALGVALGAVVMLYAFLPPLHRPITDAASEQAKTPAGPSPSLHLATAGNWPLTLLAAVSGLSLLVLRPPVFDHSTETLRPKRSSAYAALDEMKRRFGLAQEPLWLLAPGRDEREVAQRLAAVRPALEQALTGNLIKGFTLPSQLWPDPDHQAANRRTLIGLLDRREALRRAAAGASFTSNSLALTENLFATWQRAVDSPGTFWPTNESSRWALDKMTAQPGRRAGLRLPLAWTSGAPPELLALGLIYPATNAPLPLASLKRQIPDSGVLLSGWVALGEEVFDLVQRDLPRVLAPMFGLLLASLWLAFRSARDVLLSFVSLIAAGLLLHAVMTVAGWSWNLMNLMALPLLLGMGVDFSIHIQLALRRHHGDLRLVRGSVGRALLLAGSTTVAGFASLAFASNAGIASLGKVCAAGIACSMVTAIYLLPAWWSAFAAPGRAAESS